MYHKAPDKGKQLAPRVNIHNACQNASDRNIIGSAQIYKKDFCISFFGYQKAGRLREDNLKNCDTNKASVTVRVHI